MRLDEARAMIGGYARTMLATQPFPQPPFSGDCGLDLVTTEDVTLKIGETANIPCGVSVALPSGTFGWITGRSSTWTRHGLLVIPGIIDEGWRGELFTLVFRPAATNGTRSGWRPVRVPAGSRLAQLIVLPNLLPQVEVVITEDLPPSERGSSGFGSSG